VTQQARQLAWTLQDEDAPLRFLIHDRDAKFPSTFDTVFVAEGVEVVRTPYRAHGERLRRALGPLGAGGVPGPPPHRQRGAPAPVLAAYVAHDNLARPHQGIGQRVPIPCDQRARQGPVRRRDVLGGLIHEYDREAA
jgi:putative transposase